MILILGLAGGVLGHVVGVQHKVTLPGGSFGTRMVGLSRRVTFGSLSRMISICVFYSHFLSLFLAAFKVGPCVGL